MPDTRPMSSLGLAKFFLDVIAPADSGAAFMVGNKGSGKTSKFQRIAWHVLDNRRKLRALGYGNLYVLTNNCFVKYVNGKALKGEQYPPGMAHVKDFPMMFIKWALIRKADPDSRFILIIDEIQKVMAAVRASSKNEYGFQLFVDEARHLDMRLMFGTPSKRKILPEFREEMELIYQAANNPWDTLDDDEAPTYVHSYLRSNRQTNRKKARRFGSDYRDYLEFNLIDDRDKPHGYRDTLLIKPTPWSLTGGTKNGYEYDTHAFDAFGNGRTFDGKDFDIRDFFHFLGGKSSGDVPDLIMEYFGLEDFGRGNDPTLKDVIRVLAKYEIFNIKGVNQTNVAEALGCRREYVNQVLGDWVDQREQTIEWENTLNNDYSIQGVV